MLEDELQDPLGHAYIIRLWAHCQLSHRWRFEALSAGALKAVCRYPGPQEQLWIAMQNAGFLLIGTDNSATVHEWEVHNAALVRSWDNGKYGHLGGKAKAARYHRGSRTGTLGVPQGPPLGPPNRIGLDRIGEDNTKTVGRIAKAPPPTAGELIEALKNEPAYKGMDVAREVEKCRVWCEAKRKRFSKMRVVNWLNRSEAPLLDSSANGDDDEARRFRKFMDWKKNQNEPRTA